MILGRGLLPASSTISKLKEQSLSAHVQADSWSNHCAVRVGARLFGRRGDRRKPKIARAPLLGPKLWEDVPEPLSKVAVAARMCGVAAPCIVGGSKSSWKAHQRCSSRSWPTSTRTLSCSYRTLELA